MPGFTSQLCHCLHEGLWASAFLSLSLGCFYLGLFFVFFFSSVKWKWWSSTSLIGTLSELRVGDKKKALSTLLHDSKHSAKAGYLSYFYRAIFSMISFPPKIWKRECHGFLKNENCGELGKARALGISWNMDSNVVTGLSVPWPNGRCFSYKSLSLWMSCSLLLDASPLCLALWEQCFFFTSLVHLCPINDCWI